MKLSENNYLCSWHQIIRRTMMIRFKTICLMMYMLAVCGMSVNAQDTVPKDTPQLEFVMQLRVTIDRAYTIGETAHGRRVVIPITGGTFEGPRLRGTVMNGGADYQLVSNDGSRTEVEAIYSIQTDDGICIYVRNCGIICTSIDNDGKSIFYFKTAPQFEAPVASPYNWLNNAIYVCQPDWSQAFKGIVLNVWMVK